MVHESTSALASGRNFLALAGLREEGKIHSASSYDDVGTDMNRHTTPVSHTWFAYAMKCSSKRWLTLGTHLGAVDKHIVSPKDSAKTNQHVIGAAPQKASLGMLATFSRQTITYTVEGTQCMASLSPPGSATFLE